MPFTTISTVVQVPQEISFDSTQLGVVLGVILAAVVAIWIAKSVLSLFRRG